MGDAVTPIRVGVLCDTHVGDLLPRLPPGIAEVFAGVDLILHAGDLTVPGVVAELEQIAPVVAVRGNHDDLSGSALPWDATVSVGEVTIGLTHGTRPDPFQVASVALTIITGRLYTLGLARALTRRFPTADVVVFGHLHMPFIQWVGRRLVFSPGAAYTVEGDPLRKSRGPRGWVYQRLRAVLADVDRQPGVGLIEIRGRQVEARRVLLPGPLRGPLPTATSPE